MQDSLRLPVRAAPKEITIVYGAQCSGKSSFLNSVCDSDRIVSLGECVRSMSSSVAIRAEADSLIEAGREWPVDLGFRFIKSKITERTRVLDGYPRNIGELHYLTQRIIGIQALSFVYFYAPDDVLRERYNARAREDTNIDFFNLRLKQAKTFHRDIAGFTSHNHNYEIKRFQVNSFDMVVCDE